MDNFLLFIGCLIGILGWIIGRFAHTKSPPGLGNRIHAPFWINVIAGFSHKEFQLLDFALFTQMFCVLTFGLSIITKVLSESDFRKTVINICIIGTFLIPALLLKWIKTTSKTSH